MRNYMDNESEQPSFLISDRSIRIGVPDSNLQMSNNHMPNQIGELSTQDLIPSKEEERIKLYHEKVRSAISDSAKKKQREQENMLKKYAAQKERMMTQQNQADQLGDAIGFVDDLDKDCIDREMKDII